jgi:hypothetical protein
MMMINDVVDMCVFARMRVCVFVCVVYVYLLRVSRVCACVCVCVCVYLVLFVQANTMQQKTNRLTSDLNNVSA